MGLKREEICESHHTTAFEQLLTVDNEPVEICRRGASIFFLFHFNNNFEILDNLLICFKNGNIYFMDALSIFFF